MNSRTGIDAGPLGCGCCRRSPEHRRARPALPSVALFSALAFLAALSPQVLAATPTSATGSAPVASAKPAIEEWLNQNVRMRETAQAMSEPSPGGRPSGEIRAGAEVKAIGLVAGKRWVEIELPDQSQAYVPREAIEYESDSAAPAPASTSLSESPPTSAQTAAPEIASASAPGAVRGKVDRVPNAATLVVGDQRIRLSGIDPGPAEVLGPFENWIEAQGDLVCDPDAQTGRYHCLTGSGIDVAEAAILNGAGRVGDGATPQYRDSETQARNAKRGLWQGP